MVQTENPQYFQNGSVYTDAVIDGFINTPPQDVDPKTLSAGVMVGFLSVFEDKPHEQVREEVFERRRMDPLVTTDAEAGLSILLEKGLGEEDFRQKVVQELKRDITFSTFRNLVVNAGQHYEGLPDLPRTVEEQKKDIAVAALRVKATERQERRRKTFETLRASGQAAAYEDRIVSGESSQPPTEFDVFYAKATESRQKKHPEDDDIQ